MLVTAAQILNWSVNLHILRFVRLEFDIHAIAIVVTTSQRTSIVAKKAKGRESPPLNAVHWHKPL